MGVAGSNTIGCSVVATAMYLIYRWRNATKTNEVVTRAGLAYWAEMI